MSEMLTGPLQVLDQEMRDSLERSADDGLLFGPNIRDRIHVELHQDVERGGIRGVAARLELFLGKVASLAGFEPGR